MIERHEFTPFWEIVDESTFRGFPRDLLPPGPTCVSGMVGVDEDYSLTALHDDNLLMRMDVDHKEMASWLEKFTNFDEARVLKWQNIVIRVVDSRGWHKCPGGSCKHRTKIDVEIERVNSPYRMQFSGLMPHFIRDHHFFEGNTPYRVDPLDPLIFFGREETREKLEPEVWKRLNVLEDGLGVTAWCNANMFFYCHEHEGFVDLFRKKLDGLLDKVRLNPNEVFEYFRWLPFASEEIKQELRVDIDRVISKYEDSKYGWNADSLIGLRSDLLGNQGILKIKQLSLPDFQKRNGLDKINWFKLRSENDKVDARLLLRKGDVWWNEAIEKESKKMFLQNDDKGLQRQIYGLNFQQRNPDGELNEHNGDTYANAYRLVFDVTWPVNIEQHLIGFSRLSAQLRFIEKHLEWTMPENCLFGLDGEWAEIGYMHEHVDNFLKTFSQEAVRKRSDFYSWGSELAKNICDPEAYILCQLQVIICRLKLVEMNTEEFDQQIISLNELASELGNTYNGDQATLVEQLEDFAKKYRPTLDHDSGVEDAGAFGQEK